jgi:FixJ family two-component response regulator
MKNTLQNREVTVLLISDNESDIDEVKKHLEKTMGLLCHIWHCPSIIRSVGFFKKEIPEVDVILLDLGLVTSGRPRDIFRQMKDIVDDIPIIVFTGRADHELALLVVGDGAADNVTRGQFSTDPYKLRDAIEFSLARDKIVKKSASKSVSDLRYLGDQGAADIKSMKEDEEAALAGARKESSAILKEAIEHGKNDLKEAMAEAAATLKEAREANADRHREKDQIISWMGGGYSVEKTSDGKS